ncbi:SLATT domain-containing protein [Jeotgalibacillus aurantiacus]|uniref:SLATT domain-containing protein n=1 Tax=Jeotgalibacillus aurantiacus TaxID=2763266 RepID=UPI001D0A5B89|nr:SLATT domain-containing protein [Jeotgalibacillus aurantiacus]
MSEEKNYAKSIEEEFIDLKKRIKATRKSRIEASKRLRTKNNFYEKITHFYSLVVLILSVWFLNLAGDGGLFTAKVLLILSLSITYFTLFLSLRNYKERAGDFEVNYQHLDVLTNKLDRFATSGATLDETVLKSFQREYEKLIIGKENHTNIDYYRSTDENQIKYKKEIKRFILQERIANVLIAVYPIFIFLIIFIFSKIVTFFDQ